MVPISSKVTTAYSTLPSKRYNSTKSEPPQLTALYPPILGTTQQSRSHHSLQHSILQEVQLNKVRATTAYSTLSSKRYNSTKSEPPQLTALYPPRGTTQQSQSHHSLQHSILQEVQLNKVRATTAYSTLSSKRYNSTKSEPPQLTARYPPRGTTQQSQSHHSLQHTILQEVQLNKVRATTAYSTLSSKRYNSTKSEPPQLTAHYPPRGNSTKSEPPQLPAHYPPRGNSTKSEPSQLTALYAPRGTTQQPHSLQHTTT